MLTSEPGDSYVHLRRRIRYAHRGAQALVSGNGNPARIPSLAMVSCLPAFVIVTVQQGFAFSQRFHSMWARPLHLAYDEGVQLFSPQRPAPDPAKRSHMTKKREKSLFAAQTILATVAASH